MYSVFLDYDYPRCDHVITRICDLHAKYVIERRVNCEVATHAM